MKNFFRILSIPAVKYGVLAVLVAGICALLWWLAGMISENVAAENHIEQRETAVVEQEKVIKDIVKMYHEANGRYPGSMDEIIAFAQDGYKVEKSEIFNKDNQGKFKLVEISKDKDGNPINDTIWEELSYYHLMKRELDKNPSFKNEKIDTIYAREEIEALTKLTDEDIANLRYIANTDKVEFQIDTVRGTYGDHRFRCHAPYVAFLDTENYNQQFWNYIEAKFDYWVKNAEGYDDMRKKMTSEGAYKAITAVDKDGKSLYHIGSEKEGNLIDINIEFFGVTFGSLEKATLDGSWEDQRAK